MDQECPLLIMNEILCHVEYLADGSSMNMIKQYKKNPRGFSFFRKVAMKYAPTFKERFRESIHYVSSNLMIKNRKYLSRISIVNGLLYWQHHLELALYLYIQNTNKSTVLKVD